MDRVMDNGNILAHQENRTVRFIERWPTHEPRMNDPNYKYFHEARERMEKLGLLKCVVDSDYHFGEIQLHHSKLEFAHINDADINKFNELYGLHLNDAQFQVFIESEGNLEALCELHHIGQEGIHGLPEPEWRALRVAKNGQPIVTIIKENK